MFTGIVEEVGTVVAVEDRGPTRRFEIEGGSLLDDLAPGDSVAVDGACLTAVVVGGSAFGVDVIGSTLERTVAGTYGAGSRVNLERALVLGSRLDGHLVQGHVDTVGELVRCAKRGDAWEMDFRVPAEVFDLTIEHGSITLNGVSLTVSELPEPGICRVGIIPFTYEHTNLGALAPGDPVNVEGDMIGKYVARLLSARKRTAP